VRVLVRVPAAHVLVQAVAGSWTQMGIFTRFSALKSKTPLVGLPGVCVYHFLRETAEEKSRLHLRIDGDGSGLLIINASQFFNLNPTATAMTYLVLNEFSSDSAYQVLNRSIEVSKSTFSSDYSKIKNQINGMLSSETCPICDLDIETTAPFSHTPSAPYRMDLAVTYRCNNSCAHCYNARSRNFQEMSTQDWFTVLDKLWKIGIPHIVFTGGEPTLRDDLPALIRHAEDNGQITGINTNGRKLKDDGYLQKLVEAGLDHIQITFESSDPQIHDQMVCHPGAYPETLAGIINALKTHLYIMTNTTMLSTNRSSIPQTLEFLAQLGLRTVGLNALIYSGHGKSVGTGLSESALFPLLETAKEITTRHNQRLIWYTPTQYCNFDPVQYGLGVKGCTAALYNMCVEPDGSVLPCQSYYESLGNILTESWENIWNHDLSKSLRERKAIPEKCKDCGLLSECGGGCPLAV
jgi:radical SAM protein with 4Fe4S-binding SPASM domain